MKIASASCNNFTFASVTSPKILIANPGPGNGCLFNIKLLSPNTFPTFLTSSLKSVGVMGDERSYEHVICLRAVTSLDGMTADFSHLPYELLSKISVDIINKVKGINRVVFDISSKPPATIEWE